MYTSISRRLFCVSRLVLVTSRCLYEYHAGYSHTDLRRIWLRLLAHLSAFISVFRISEYLLTYKLAMLCVSGRPSLYIRAQVHISRRLFRLSGRVSVFTHLSAFYSYITMFLYPWRQSLDQPIYNFISRCLLSKSPAAYKSISRATIDHTPDACTSFVFSSKSAGHFNKVNHITGVAIAL